MRKFITFFESLTYWRFVGMASLSDGNPYNVLIMALFSPSDVSNTNARRRTRDEWICWSRPPSLARRRRKSRCSFELVAPLPLPVLRVSEQVELECETTRQRQTHRGEALRVSSVLHEVYGETTSEDSYAEAHRRKAVRVPRLSKEI